MRSAAAGADRTAWLQGHGYGARHAVAPSVAPVTPQHDARAADPLRMPDQGCEHFVFSIRASLRVAGFVFADHFDPHRFHDFRSANPKPAADSPGYRKAAENGREWVAAAFRTETSAFRMKRSTAATIDG